METKSSFKSKINWTQGVAVFASLLTMFGFNLTPEEQATIVSAIAIITGIVTWVLRTWFTKKLTNASAKGGAQ